MKRLTLAAAVLATALMAITLARLGAEDAAPSDKWQQITDNHKKMTASLDLIEQNLNFVKARSTSGGRRTN